MKSLNMSWVHRILVSAMPLSSLKIFRVFEMLLRYWTLCILRRMILIESYSNKIC